LFHGHETYTLLSFIHFKPSNDIDEYKLFLSPFSQKKSGDIFFINNFLLNNICREFEELRSTNTNQMQIILNNKQQIKEQEQIINTMNQTISVLNSKIEKMDNVAPKQDQDLVIKEQYGKKLEKELEPKYIDVENLCDSEDEINKYEKWKVIKPTDIEGDIFIAAKEGKLTSVVYLLANNIEVDLKDSNNSDWHWKDSTALHYASANGHISIVEYLVNKGADINAKNCGIIFRFFHHPLFNIQHKMVFIVLVNVF